VIVIVEPPASVTLETVIVCPEVDTDPALAVVYPAFDPVVDGALQPLGTATVTLPFERPPAAAVYVNVIVFPVDALLTEPVGVVSVPDPSAESTLMLGEAPRLVSEPPEVDFSLPCHVADPALLGAFAPGPPPLVAPYVTVSVAPPASDTLETVIVWPDTETVPLVAAV
jgi:hypothetical protein